MIAMGVLTIGSSAIIAMQRVSVMGTVSSQNLVNGSSIAAGVAARIGSEANATWSTVNPDGLSGTLFNQGKTNLGAWRRADPSNAVKEAATGLQGQHRSGAETALPVEQVAYCSFFRITKLNDDTVRVDVRTMYSRQGNPIGDECALSAPTVNAMLDSPTGTVTTGSLTHVHDEYGVAFISTAVRRVNL